jgi:glycosyltransferase involved in cell wall biosynthesis
MPPVDVSVLVPVYNNAATLEELIDRLLVVLDAGAIAFELICVDDGSRDASLAILERRAAGDARIRVFALVRNFGGQAASCAACDQVRGRRVVHIDADLENFPEDIPLLLEYLDRGYDLVCGVREQRRDAWLTRRLPSLLINYYVRRQSGIRIRDVGCGLRALDARLIRNLAAEGEARRLLTPVLLRRARRVAQVPVRHRPKAERGGHSFLSLLGIALDYYLLTARRPFLLSGLLCAATLLIGVALIAVGPRLAGLIVAGIGSLGGLLSLIGEYVQHLYRLAQNAPFYELQDLATPGALPSDAPPTRSGHHAPDQSDPDVIPN